MRGRSGEANVWLARAHLPAGDKGPGPAPCREPVRGAVRRSPLVKDGALPEEIGRKARGQGEVGVSSASLPAGLSEHDIPTCCLDPISHL